MDLQKLGIQTEMGLGKRTLGPLFSLPSLLTPSLLGLGSERMKKVCMSFGL